jgi:hypothetical protein
MSQAQTPLQNRLPINKCLGDASSFLFDLKLREIYCRHFILFPFFSFFIFVLEELEMNPKVVFI